MPPQHARPTVRAAFASPFDLQTYRNLAYLLLAIPLGLAYFVLLTTAVSLTLGLSITLAGPVLVLLTLLLVVGVAAVDVRLSNALLGMDVPHPEFPERGDGAVDTVVAVLTSRDAWLGGLYLGWRAVLGVVALLVLTVGFSLSTGLLVAPLVYGDVLIVDYRLGTWAIDTFDRALVAASAGFVVGVATLVAANLLATLSGVLTRATFEWSSETSESTTD